MIIIVVSELFRDAVMVKCKYPQIFRTVYLVGLENFTIKLYYSIFKNFSTGI